MVLTAIIAMELNRADQSDNTDLSPVQAQPVTVVPPVTAAQADVQGWIDTILARPLFAFDRRQIPAAITKAPQLGRLAAILISPGSRCLIFAGDPDTPKPIIVTEGGHIGTDVVVSITSDQATLVGPYGTRTIRPSFSQPETTSHAARPSELKPSPTESRIAKHVQ